MTKVIDRNTKEIYEEKSPKGASFLYRNIFGRIILKIANKRFISSIGGWYMNRKVSARHVKNFIKDNNINMDEYPSVKYKSFNEFFSREIKEGKRTFSKKDNELCAPSDSKVTVYKIDDKQEFVIKGKTYTIERILRDKELSEEYKNGYFLVFRLSVDDYHRYSYIDDGKVLSKKKIKGVFNTVGPIAFERFKVYEENQREYEVLETKNFGKIIQMEVGALMVGRIVNHDKPTFKRGEEKGYFLFGGSTIVVMVKEDIIEIDEDILNNSKEKIETKVKQGNRIARRR